MNVGAKVDIQVSSTDLHHFDSFPPKLELIYLTRMAGQQPPGIYKCLDYRPCTQLLSTVMRPSYACMAHILLIEPSSITVVEYNFSFQKLNAKNVAIEN